MELENGFCEIIFFSVLSPRAFRLLGGQGPGWNQADLLAESERVGAERASEREIERERRKKITRMRKQIRDTHTSFTTQQQQQQKHHSSIAKCKHNFHLFLLLFCFFLRK